MKKIEVIILLCLISIIPLALGNIINPEFSYNETLINSSNNEYKLNLITTSENYTTSFANSSYITLAKQKFIDVTNKLQAKDNKFVLLNKNNNWFNTIDIIFDHNLTNNDKIIMYLKGIFNSEIYLCPYETQCNSPGYGLLNYDGEEGFYEITISNLTESTNRLRIDPPEIVIIDYVYVNYTIYEEHTNITSHYPESSFLISDFIEPENISYFGLLEKQEELNNQSILYEYTLDDINYSLIEDSNLSYINSTKIKFKITLQSDTLNTPLLRNLTLNYYLKELCIENWTCSEWSECINLTQTRICSDFNNCGTELEKPVETQNCTEENIGNSGNTGGGDSAPSSIYQSSKTEQSTPELSETEAKNSENKNQGVELSEQSNKDTQTKGQSQEKITSNIIKEPIFFNKNLKSIVTGIMLMVLAVYIFKKQIK